LIISRYSDIISFKEMDVVAAGRLSCRKANGPGGLIWSAATTDEIAPVKVAALMLRSQSLPGRGSGLRCIGRTENPPRPARGHARGRHSPAFPKNGECNMYADEIEQPFDSIESAHDFMNVLAEMILEAMKELHHDRERAIEDGEQRRADAIQLAMFKLKTLTCHVHKSRTALNDLRSIRRLILNERRPKARAAAGTGD
jgi:hypothetical protein